MLIRLLDQKAVVKKSILRKPSENMNVLRYRKLCLSQMDRCVMAVSQVDRCAERDSLEDWGDVWKMGSTPHLEPVSLTDSAAITKTVTLVYKLRVASKCPCNYTFLHKIPSAALCCLQVQRERYQIWASNTCSDIGCDKSDTYNSEQCFICDWVTHWYVFFSLE